LIVVPLIAATLLMLLGDDARRARFVALGASLLTFALSLLLWSKFDMGNGDFQFVEKADLFGQAFSYHLGADGISLTLIALTGLLMPLCILASWTSITVRVRDYMIAFLVMEALMMGVFVSLDMMLFYVFFEAGLIPMYLIIGVWGGKRRIYASFKFFLYTLLGSVLMLLAMLYMINQAGTTSIPALVAYHFDPHIQIWLWLAFFASFAVKCRCGPSILGCPMRTLKPQLQAR
jgi:NADH-quinone oxidoreductase subunit M